MPSHIPRTDTAKKKIQLAQREQELEHAVRSGYSRENLIRVAEKLRIAHLSLLKAELYWTEEARIRGSDVAARLAKIDDENQKWRERSVDEILNDFNPEVA